MTTLSETQHRYEAPHRTARQDVSWSKLYAARRAAADRFGANIFALPIVRRVLDVVQAGCNPRTRMLEIGAGDRGLVQKLASRGISVQYESLDIDTALPHDYRELADVPGPYERIVALEVVEHLSLDELRPWLARVAELLAPGGQLVLSTPNTFYPPAYLRDATHRTPLCYDELASLVTLAGLEPVRIVRIYHDPVHRKLARRYLFGWLFRLLGIDFARQIMLVAEKPGSPQPAEIAPA
ncbi:MAG: methyltransferase domain-containing protein [Pirellulales bacterium]|nr:methyltransferase domain-containing protein [Pirellulales bacterium]